MIDDKNTLFYYLGGSATFCTNCGDSDIVCVQENVERATIREEGVDTFCFDVETFRNRLSFNETAQYRYRELYNVGFAMLKEQGKVYGEMPEDIANYNWFDYKDKVIERCVEQCDVYILNPRYRNSLGKDLCLKHGYWLIANYYALVNNSLEFTDEQLEILQKCHDNELPRTYAEDVYKELVGMLPKQETTTSTERTTKTKTLSYDELVNQKIRARYSLSAELAILRQRDTKSEEFAEYYAYCEQCKAEAKAELGIE